MKLSTLLRFWLFLLLGFHGARSLALTNTLSTSSAPASQSQVLEVTGSLLLSKSGSLTWAPINVGNPVEVGDRIQTGAKSRATLQLSDRSIVRLSENTTLVIQLPRSQEKHRFGLLDGLLYFLNREKPSEIEFETPTSTGAIRGTEFSLAFFAANSNSQLWLYDGRVDLTAAGESVSMTSGEQAEVTAGRPPSKSPLLLARRSIQWALYYPAVLVPSDLGLDPIETNALSQVLVFYTEGDFAAAAREMEPIARGEPGRETLRAALELVSGRVAAAESLLQSLPADSAGIRALSELIETVRKETQSLASDPKSPPRTASEWLARSYSDQGYFHLVEALNSAIHATDLAGNSGIAWARRAELELALSRLPESAVSLRRAIQLAPRLATAQTVLGYAQLEQHQWKESRATFGRALELDAALGSAWLGKAQSELALSQPVEALRSLQTAAALEPQRSLHRAYLGKAFSQNRETELARKEFRIAQSLDPEDPTAPFYQALQAWQDSRPNAAVDSLSRSIELNDNRRLFRSQQALDHDLAIRQSNLAALYRDAGLPEMALQSASLAVAEDYSNFSAHQFLARTLQSLEDPYRVDLKLEAARQNEFTLAALLAPPGAAGLSQLALQPEHIEWFMPRPVAVAARAEYRSSGDWFREGSVYGGLDGLSYAVDVSSIRVHGESPNGRWNRDDVLAHFKQRITDNDAAWFQLGWSDSDQGDIARRLDPNSAVPDFRAREEQLPTLRLGWQHQWSPENQTLLLFGRLSDSLQVTNPEPQILFVHQSAGVPTSVSTAPLFHEQAESDYVTYSADLQHVWQPAHHTIVTGCRYQQGSIDRTSTLVRDISGPLPEQSLEATQERVGGYLYETWTPIASLHLIVGLSYDHLSVPRNAETTPSSEGQRTRDQVSPKLGLIYSPWKSGVLRAAWTRSLGGYLFDSNLQLEPAQVAGFPQTFRSLLPESVGGLFPAARNDSAQLRFDQSFQTKTDVGIELGLLESNGERTLGTLVNSLPIPVANTPGDTRETIHFRERQLGLNAVQRIGDGVSIGLRYRLSEATWDRGFPELPAGLPGIDGLEGREQAVLSDVQLSLQYEHTSGFFARWESECWMQHSGGARASAGDESLWQHTVWTGWRFLSRRAEVRLGLLNLAGTDYRLNPLNEYGRLPRHRTWVASVRFEF